MEIRPKRSQRDRILSKGQRRRSQRCRCRCSLELAILRRGRASVRQAKPQEISAKGGSSSSPQSSLQAFPAPEVTSSDLSRHARAPQLFTC
mmetsp:Transcript_18888/g.32843  ORF Transcript_18888/g.32843 Transcript_18888/m.32843 type:complete len:91 (-) Transcript_18888:15-287(-)